jgi:gliding motility-associated-like protein
MSKLRKHKTGVLIICFLSQAILCLFSAANARKSVPGKAIPVIFSKPGSPNPAIAQRAPIPGKNGAAPVSQCNTINWASWSQFRGYSAVGTVVNAGKQVDVLMTANYPFDSTPDIYGYPTFSSYPIPIPNSTVPRTTWSAGAGGLTSMCFSQQVANPVLLLSSLGSVTQPCKITFSLPYVVLYDGGKMQYNDNRSITGTEGYAIVMFPGNFTCVNISSQTPEFYTNITWGLMPPTFQVNIAGNTTGCDQVTLTAGGGQSYLWDDGLTPNSPTNTFNTSGTYIVTVTRADGCVAYLADSVTITTPLSPAVSIAASANQAICAGTPVSFTATPTNGGASPSYQWLRGAVPVGANSPTFSSSSLTDGDVISCMMTSSAGCIAPSTAISNAVTVSVASSVSPAVMISPSVNDICAGTPVTFTATPVNGGSLPAYQWQVGAVNTGGNSATFTSSSLADGDVVTCVMSSSANCAVPANTTSNTIVMRVNAAPVVTAGGNKTINKGAGIKLNATATGDIGTITWSPATGLDNDGILQPVANPATTTMYTLTVISKEGCIGKDSVTVTITTELSIPNTITPNGDGINDTWDIGNASYYPNMTVDIFDRYGQGVFHSLGYRKPWDGTFNGKRLPAGVYYYVINLNDKRPKSGWVAILR